MEINEANEQKAQELLEKHISDAQEVIQDPSKLDIVLAQLEEKLKEFPKFGVRFSELPLMTGMLKAWAAKEYTEVSDKVIARLIGAVLYLTKKNDLIWDDIPAVGIADDLAVMALALRRSRGELKAFSEWKESNHGAPA